MTILLVMGYSIFPFFRGQVAGFNKDYIFNHKQGETDTTQVSVKSDKISYIRKEVELAEIFSKV